MTDQLTKKPDNTTNNIHHFTQRVYYEDTDFSGMVYHARYLHFMERARTELIRDKGLIQSQIYHADKAEDCVAFVVRRMLIDYCAPAQMDDILTITTEFINARGARMDLLQSVYRDKTLLIKADVCIVCVNGKGQPRRLPSSVF